MGVDSSQKMFFMSKETINSNQQLHMKNYLHQDLILYMMYVNHF
jgi:hypothetical protein